MKEIWSNLKGSINTINFGLVLLARRIETSDEHFAIVESQSSNSYIEKKTFAFMAETPEEVVRRFKEQARVQKEQQEMLRVQQESIMTSS